MSAHEPRTATIVYAVTKSGVVLRVGRAWKTDPYTKQRVPTGANGVVISLDAIPLDGHLELREVPCDVEGDHPGVKGDGR
jgi:hypothetical protein